MHQFQLNHSTIIFLHTITTHTSTSISNQSPFICSLLEKHLSKFHHLTKLPAPSNTLRIRHHKSPTNSNIQTTHASQSLQITLLSLKQTKAKLTRSFSTLSKSIIQTSKYLSQNLILSQSTKHQWPLIQHAALSISSPSTIHHTTIYPIDSCSVTQNNTTFIDEPPTTNLPIHVIPPTVTPPPPPSPVVWGTTSTKRENDTLHNWKHKKKQSKN